MEVSINQTFFYGDTSTRPQVKLYSLTERIEPALYKTDAPTRAFDAGTVWGSQQMGATSGGFLLETDELGRQMFDYIQDNADTLIESAFLDRFKGFVLRVDEAEGVEGLMVGGVGRRSAQSVEITARIYYHSPTDTAAIDLISANDSTVYYRVEQDRSQTPLADLKPGLSVPTADLGNLGFVQGLSNVRTVLSFDALAGLKSRTPSIAIQRAELVVPAIGDARFGTSLAPPPNLVLIETSGDSARALFDNSGEVAINYFNDAGQNGYLFVYNEASNSYPLILTDFVKKWLPSTGNPRYPFGPPLALSVMQQSSGRLFRPFASDPRRLVLPGGGDPAQPLRIKVYYVEVPGE
ncbi:MAG: hypothetical protein WBA12_07435, partial [Catalinimonas sp.]